MEKDRPPDEIDFFAEHNVYWDHTGDKNNPYLFVDARNPLPPSFLNAVKVAGQAVIRFPLNKLGRRKPPRQP